MPCPARRGKDAMIINEQCVGIDMDVTPRDREPFALGPVRSGLVAVEQARRSQDQRSVRAKTFSGPVIVPNFTFQTAPKGHHSPRILRQFRGRLPQCRAAAWAAFRGERPIRDRRRAYRGHRSRPARGGAVLRRRSRRAHCAIYGVHKRRLATSGRLIRLFRKVGISPHLPERHMPLRRAIVGR